MTSCYDNFTLLIPSAHSRITGSLQNVSTEGISDSGYFSYPFPRCIGRSQSIKQPGRSIFMDSAKLRLPQGIWTDIASDTPAALCETFRNSVKKPNLIVKNAPLIPPIPYTPHQPVASQEIMNSFKSASQYSLCYLNKFYKSNSAPGFMIPFGSKTSLMPFISASSAGSFCCASSSTLILPMPCSPVTVPSKL